MSWRVETLALESPVDEARWHDYVDGRATAVGDLYEWRRVLAAAYGIRSHYLLAAGDDGVPAAALALFEARHPVFGRYLTTAAFGTDGGFHGEDPEARSEVLAHARGLAGRLGVSHLVVRGRGAPLEGSVADRRYVTGVLDLSGGPERVWEARLDAKTRNQVRRGAKEGFEVTIGPGQRAPFLRVFHEHMRDLGSPAHGRRYYEAIAAQLGSRCDFFVVRDGTALVGGALVFYVNGVAANVHTVALRQYNRRCPNYHLYWKIIEAAYARGCHALDMGRSGAGSTQIRFKENWGSAVVPLCYSYFLRERRDLPFLDPRNPRYRLAVAVWRRLPLVLTRRLGPWLISGLL